MLHHAKKLEGYKLGAHDGEIGRVKDFYFDDETWTIRYLVADTGTWLPGKQVLLSPFALKTPDAGHDVLPVNLTKSQIENSPSIHADKPVSRQYEIDYYKYYGWPMYWEGPALWGPTPVPAYYGHGGGPVQTQTRPTEQGDPHLRSTKDMEGYHLQARDDEIGHVDDYIIDDENWVIRYLVVDTRNWWPGKKVLVAPPWIEKISWEQSKVFVDLLRETVKGAPEYDAGSAMTRDYELKLFDYYNRDTYWTREAEAGHVTPTP